MKITVTDGKLAKTHSFREGIRACDAIAAFGFDFSLPCGGTGRCGKCLCEVNENEVLACRTALFRDSVIRIDSPETAVLNADELVVGADGTVIDIGTTTVAAASFKDGRAVKRFGAKNPQCAFGADVISRIGAKNTAPLTESVRRLVTEIRHELSGESTVIVGNTAMLSLYCGMDTSKMGVYPFEMPSKFDFELGGAYFPPCLSAFVGADALCSLLRCNIGDNESALVIDFGTNGEIGLVHDGKTYFTSAAAGPALEGAGISRGMTAARGAIYHVRHDGIDVIGDESPRGICGSGLVDAVALMLEGSAIDSAGMLEKPWEIPSGGIFLTQADIRAFQLCKAAISAATELLLEKAGIKVSELDKIYLSGALGKSINVKNAMAVGLLPRLSAEKFKAVGNGALLGGAMLLGEEGREKIRRIASDAETINVAGTADFSERFIGNINFF